MLVVTTPDWNAVSGGLQRYQRSQPSGRWKRVGEPVRLWWAKNGLGWGAGLRRLAVARWVARRPGEA